MAQVSTLFEKGKVLFEKGRSLKVLELGDSVWIGQACDLLSMLNIGDLVTGPKRAQLQDLQTLGCNGLPREGAINISKF